MSRRVIIKYNSVRKHTPPTLAPSHILKKQINYNTLSNNGEALEKRCFYVTLTLFRNIVILGRTLPNKQITPYTLVKCKLHAMLTLSKSECLLVTPTKAPQKKPLFDKIPILLHKYLSTPQTISPHCIIHTV
jgi:hypothetical protein